METDRKEPTMARNTSTTRNLRPQAALDSLGPAAGSRRADRGAVTAEYAIALLAAAGFAGLLVTLLTSDTARGWLTNIIESALSL
jgi:hypothetical protein